MQGVVLLPSAQLRLFATAGSVAIVELVVMTTMLEQTLAKAAVDAGALTALVLACGQALMARPLAASQQRLIESEHRLRDYVEASSDWVWETGPDHRFTYFSTVVPAGLGADLSEYLGRCRWELAARDAGVDWEGHRRTLDERQPFRDFEYPLPAPDGETRWLRVSGRPRFDAEGRFLGYRGVSSDFTVEKMMRREVERGRQLLARVLDVSLDGFLILAAVRDSHGAIHDFRVLRANARAARFVGTTPRQLLGRLVRGQVPTLVDDDLFLFAIHTVKTGRAFDLERHLALPGGGSAEVRIVGVRLDDGLVVTLSDVSERHAAERQRRLAMTVFEAAGQAMLVTDAAKTIVAVNPAFTAITGYAAEEAIGRTPAMLASGRHEPEFYDRMWAAIRTHGRWIGEVWNRHKGGQPYLQRLEISVVRDVDDSVRNYVGVFADITDEKERSERIHYRAYHDALTGLPNRLLLADRLTQAIAQARREKTGLAVAFLDLDGFKPVNDHFGHLVGDALLQQVARRLEACVRQSDTVARLGGDEFVMITLEVESDDDALRLVGKAVDVLAQPFTIDEQQLTIGASAGVALFPRHGAVPDDLLNAADQAMYAAKRDGRGVVRLVGRDL